MSQGADLSPVIPRYFMNPLEDLLTSLPNAGLKYVSTFLQLQRTIGTPQLTNLGRELLNSFLGDLMLPLDPLQIEGVNLNGPVNSQKDLRINSRVQFFILNFQIWISTPQTHQLLLWILFLPQPAQQTLTVRITLKYAGCRLPPGQPIELRLFIEASPLEFPFQTSAILPEKVEIPWQIEAELQKAMISIFALLVQSVKSVGLLLVNMKRRRNSPVLSTDHIPIALRSKPCAWFRWGYRAT